MEHILSLSYGKDSLACLGAIEQLGWPLDRIVHAEVWATDTIPADLPPMVEFKKKRTRSSWNGGALRSSMFARQQLTTSCFTRFRKIERERIQRLMANAEDFRFKKAHGVKGI